MNTPNHTPTPDNKDSLLSQHTSKPWTAYKRSRSTCTIEVEGLDMRSVVARLNDNELCPEHGGSIEANAAHIVRCVNGFDGLVEALSSMYQQMIHFERAWKDAGVGDIYEEVVGKAEAALKAVNSGEGY